MKLILLTILPICIFLASCKTTKVTLDYYNPATIAIPKEIQTIAFVDKTKAQNEVLNIIEGGLTGEGIGEDAEAVSEIHKGIGTIIVQSNKFKLIKDPQRYKTNSILQELPAAMTWDEIDRICKTQNAQAVLAVEMFDSDFSVSHEAKVDPKTKKTVVYATGKISITGLVRLYDNLNKTLLDEYKIQHSQQWKAKAETVNEAIKALKDKRQATLNAAYSFGLSYGRRIAPSKVYVKRTLFNRPKKDRNIQAGIRQSEVAEWTAAIESWKGALSSPKDKIAGRAAYNIAVAYEVLNNFDLAKEWASKAYTQYGNKKAKEYFDELNRRERLNKAAQKQLE